MIVVGIVLLVTIFAAAMFAAVRRCKWFSEISRHRVSVFHFFGLRLNPYRAFFYENVK
jgi:hypothetical protein